MAFDDLGSLTALQTAWNAVLNNSVPDESIEPDDHFDLFEKFVGTCIGLGLSLRANPNTGGYSIEVTDGDLIYLNNSGFKGGIDNETLTTNRTWQFPDKDGVIAMLSDIVAPISAHSGLTLDDGSNPHGTNKSDIGLGSVPNTDFTTPVADNTAKATNATHTSEVTGDGALTVHPLAVSNKPVLGSLAGTEEFLVNDGGVLKKVLASNVGASLYTGSGSLSASTVVTMGGFNLDFQSGQTTTKGAGNTSGTIGFLVENASNQAGLKIDRKSVV